MAVLAICNSIFLMHNINNWTVNIDETSIILTFIGFFFTFTGIYVFSIFNTNVEWEKEEIRELKNKYENELISANKGIQSVRKLVYFYQMGQLIVNSPKMNIHIFAWIQEVNNLYKEQTDYMNELYKRGLPIYSNYRQDLLSVCRGLSQSLSIMVERIEGNEVKFFEGTGLPQSEHKNLLEKLKDLSELLTKEIEVTEDLETQTILEHKDKSFTQRIISAWKVLKGNSQ